MIFMNKFVKVCPKCKSKNIRPAFNVCGHPIGWYCNDCKFELFNPIEIEVE